MLFGREQPQRNDDPDHAARAGFMKRAFRWFVLAMVVLLGGGLAVWVVTGPGPDKPKLIASNDVPNRRAPDDQSGLVPNRDQPIYEQVSPGREKDRGQELLKEPERPMGQAEVKAQAQAQDQGRVVDQSSPPAAASVDSPPSTAATPPSPPLSIPKIPLDTTPAQPLQQEYRIQIASVRTPEQAEAEWKRVANRHPDLLSQLAPSFDRYETQNNGTYYRVQGGPLVDKELANLLCAQLDARKVPCIVISP